MDKATAKLLVSELIERSFEPQIRERAGDYTVMIETS